MTRLLLIAAAAGAIYWVAFRGGVGGSRRLTAADLPKLRQLQLRKAGLGRELALCMNSAERSAWKRAFSSAGIGALVGAFVGAIAGGVGPGVKAARSVAGVVTKLWPKGDDCAAAAQKLVDDLAAHDALSDALGLNRDLTVEDVQAIATSLGGYAAVNAELAKNIDAVSDRLYGDGYREAAEAALARLRYGMD